MSSLSAEVIMMNTMVLYLLLLCSHGEQKNSILLLRLPSNYVSLLLLLPLAVCNLEFHETDCY